MKNIKSSLLKYIEKNRSFDFNDILYSIKKSYRYLIAILLIKSILSAENICRNSKIINDYWRYLFQLIIILILFISIYDYQSGILLATIIMIQKCFR